MTSNEERKLTRYQRGLVDTCFEEGQYEPGMELLDQMRSSSLRPHADHIRQLLYIALFPPPHLTGDKTFYRERSPPSPVKASPSKQKPSLSKTSLSPSTADSEIAQRVLFSFLATNSPSSLSAALPSYPSEGTTASDPNDDHDDDSLIAHESLCIRNSRNCWSILKEGFIQRKTLIPVDTRKKRTRSTYDVDDPDLDSPRVTPAVIAEHAWPILDWLLSLFEKDELSNFQNSRERFSPLLLSQIPPPRDGSGPRREADVPLDIIFHSIKQDNGQRRGMAARLLTLLVNLTFSGSFDGTMLVTALTIRLYTSSPQTVQILMESLPKTVPVLTFKITVSQKFLSSGPPITGGPKPRPRPLPRRGPRREPSATSAVIDNDGRVGSSAPPPTLATCLDVLQLLRSDHKSPRSASAPVLAIKYVLLMSYTHLQWLLPPEERDSDWKGALSNGGLKQVVDAAFPGDSTYHTALTIFASVWPPSD